jgi:trans-aconitate methyltransferase
MSWREYWNNDTPIYVNSRHKHLHYQNVAADLVALIDELFPGSQPVVLDYGCGEALSAERVAEHCERLYLLESASRVVSSLRARLATSRRVMVLMAGEEQSLPAASLDLIIMNSVVQYLTRGELQALLKSWHSQLNADGMLVLADIMPRQLSTLTDALALLRFAARDGFLLAAIAGLIRTVFSDYRQLRQRLGLAHYDEAELLELLQAAGFSATRRPRNLGHNAARRCFVARFMASADRSQ